MTVEFTDAHAEQIVRTDERGKSNTRRLDQINGQIGKLANETAGLRTDLAASHAEVRVELHVASAALAEDLAGFREQTTEKLNTIVNATSIDRVKLSMLVAGVAVLMTGISSSVVGVIVVRAAHSPAKATANDQKQTNVSAAMAITRK